MQFHHISSPEVALYLHCEPYYLLQSQREPSVSDSWTNESVLFNESAKRFTTLVSYVFESDSLRQRLPRCYVKSLKSFFALAWFETNRKTFVRVILVYLLMTTEMLEMEYITR